MRNDPAITGARETKRADFFVPHAYCRIATGVFLVTYAVSSRSNQKRVPALSIDCFVRRCKRRLGDVNLKSSVPTIPRRDKQGCVICDTLCTRSGTKMVTPFWAVHQNLLHRPSPCGIPSPHRRSFPPGGGSVIVLKTSLGELKYRAGMERCFSQTLLPGGKY